MPSPETRERFIARVEENAHAEETFFYDPAQRIPRPPDA